MVLSPIKFSEEFYKIQVTRNLNPEWGKVPRSVTDAMESLELLCEAVEKELHEPWWRREDWRQSCRAAYYNEDHETYYLCIYKQGHPGGHSGEAITVESTKPQDSKKKILCNSLYIGAAHNFRCTHEEGHTGRHLADECIPWTDARLCGLNGCKRYYDHTDPCRTEPWEEDDNA